MEKKNYKILILVLASDDSNHSLECREVWKKYKDLMSEIKVLFVYGKLFGKINNINHDYDLIYEEILESYPVKIDKTLKAFNDIKEKYTFDFILRTNLSTFWDFNILLEKIKILPKINCYCGQPWNFTNSNPDWTNYYPQSTNYVSGTNILISYDLFINITNNNELIDKQMIEDITIGNYLNTICNIPIIKSELYWIENIKELNENIIKNMIYDAKNKQIPNYRVKSNSPNRTEIDLFIYKILLQNIYNINI